MKHVFCVMVFHCQCMGNSISLLYSHIQSAWFCTVPFCMQVIPFMNTMHIHVDNEVMNIILNVDGLVQERRDSIANALELCLFYTNPSIYCMKIDVALLS